MKIEPRFDIKGNHIGYQFNCPACHEEHAVGKSWQFNGDYDKPTFQPSVLVTGRRFTPSGQADYDAWYASGCPPRSEGQFDSAPTVCHSWITDGQIEFLADCTHAFAGKKVSLPDLGTP